MKLIRFGVFIELALTTYIAYIGNINGVVAILCTSFIWYQYNFLKQEYTDKQHKQARR